MQTETADLKNKLDMLLDSRKGRGAMSKRPIDSYGMTAEQSAANVARIEAGTDTRRKLAECVCPIHCPAWDRGCSPTVGADDRLTCPQADVPRRERK